MPLLSILLAALAIGGCGYKGPLYLPQDEPAAKPAAVKPAPQPDRTAPSGFPQ